MRPALAVSISLATLLMGCQAAEVAPEASAREAVAAQTTEALPGFSIESCRQLGTFAIAIADGRRDGITRAEALETAQAGPFTPLFQSIVTGVYNAPQPRDADGWIALRKAFATVTTQSCIEAATGRVVTVRTPD